MLTNVVSTLVVTGVLGLSVSAFITALVLISNFLTAILDKGNHAQ